MPETILQKGFFFDENRIARISLSPISLNFAYPLRCSKPGNRSPELSLA